MQAPEEKSVDSAIKSGKQEQPPELPTAWRHFLEVVSRHYSTEKKQSE
ncbi:hypothetical protein ACFLFF_19890 [Brevibacillus reuszeri]|nr:hypothetical protein [Brevibacillus reuszeri]